MLKDSAQNKSDEQYPLLMVSGAGDAVVRNPPPVIDPQLWNTTVVPRRPWSERWPEYLSTCWMTFILLGISFLVFYAVGMVVIYRNEAYVLVKCNETKPASEVFYHHILPRGGAFPLSNYEEYLANVATLYPSLRFYVYFLIDDTNPAKTSLLEKLNPYNFYEEYNVYNKREVRLFQKRFPNVNISVMPLSKYMASTPLKFRWRSISTEYIPFYCRIFAVWINGGVGLDLAAHNEQYHDDNPQRIDRKARALLKQHNDGISPEKYMQTLNQLEREDEAENLSSFICIMQKMFNETINTLFSSISPPDNSSENPMEPAFPQLIDSKSLVRTHRNKREAVDTKQENETNPDIDPSHPAVVNIVLSNKTVVNETADSNKKHLYQISAYGSNVNTETTHKKAIPELAMGDEGWHFLHNFNNDDSKLGLPELFKNPHSNHESKKNKSVAPQIVMFYDFSLISEPMRSDVYINLRNISNPLKSVTLGAAGSFVASTTRLHPFLGAILSAGCKRLPPKLAIQNALLTRCPGSFKDESYCNSVHVI